ncbi:MAG: 5-dehydro-2-deoxygluconokinase [Rhizobiaceae bacterium]|nr:5-dehydro-2-deoxygluconokinase [Rhizobiaceae bacterium]
MNIDVITIGRSSVDLYGSQVGGRLEDMRSFNKYIGGSPTNIATGSARLGLKSALITRVGDEPMGRFVREQLIAEGVNVEGVKTDPDRLTALVLLGIRDDEQFPLIFYRENCADMALCEADIEESFIRRAKSVVVTGTHLSHPDTENAVLKALAIARSNKIKTALDIDYRPNLWGLSGHDDGDNRYIESQRVSEKLQSTLHLFDLIVGTEEEFHVAGGSTDIIKALKKVRSLTRATLVCKRGPMGASAFVADIPDTLEEGMSGPGFEVEVFNILGAGDGFMSGLLKGWLDNEDWQTSLKYANACGALAVSRHGCTPAYPSWIELQYFLKNGSSNLAVRKDAILEHLHWSTNRRKDWPDLKVFAFDHRSQMEELADNAGANRRRIGEFKKLCLGAAIQVAQSQDGFGILCDSQLGQGALYDAAETGLWIGRPAELPGSRPLQLEPELGLDFGNLAEWPQDHVVKVLCFYHPDDDVETKTRQEEVLIRLFAASRRNGLDFLLEIVPSKVGECTNDTAAQIIHRFYDIGIYPDWWKLEPMKNNKAWEITCAAVSENDPHCRGIVVLGLDASMAHLADSFASAARHELVKGFAIGRTIFGAAAKAWFADEINDRQAIDMMSQNYARLCKLWDNAKTAKGEAA